MEPYTRQALEHIRYLSETIGGRGSTTQKVRDAGEYAAAALSSAGVRQIDFEPFMGSPSTYLPYTMAFFAAVIGSAVALFVGNPAYLALGAVLNLLGTWAMLAESDFKPHWGHLALKKVRTQNVVGVVPPSGPATRRTVLFAHLDTHRTPIFFSSTRWQNIFTLLVTACFLSMALGFVLFGVAALFGWDWMRWCAVILLPVQIFALYLVGTADQTPFNPGANDDASGVGLMLALATRLKAEPLAHTTVTLLFTDCEETNAYGMRAFLDKHAAEYGPEAIYATLDEMALGVIKWNTIDGLIVKHTTHPKALALARSVARALPDIKTAEGPGPTYTDALPASMRGLISLTLCTVPEDEAHFGGYLHQMGDNFEHIDLATLEAAGRFTWELLRQVDA